MPDRSPGPQGDNAGIGRTASRMVTETLPVGWRAAVAHYSRRFTLNQISTLMGVLGLLLILVTSSFMIWNERKTLFEEARDHAQGSASFLADHAKRLFEVSDIA